MICHGVFILQAIQKSVSILSQSARIRDSMYLHVFKRGTSVTATANRVLGGGFSRTTSTMVEPPLPVIFE